MNHKIIVDSCCDLSPELKQEIGVISVPLTMRLGDREFIDDETLDIHDFLNEMKACKDKVSSASPSPHLYAQAIQSVDDPYVITLSSQLSGSYGSAVTGNLLAQEAGKGDAYIIDSKSASAGQTLVALMLRELLSKYTERESVVKAIESFVSSMKTYFVLENYDNLQKNGRLNKITGKLIQILNIKLIMGSDGNGSIALYKKARGEKQVISQLMELIESSGKDTKEESLVISHCNNADLANRLASVIKQKFKFQKIWIVPTGGLSSLYADDKGVILAF